LQFQTNGTTTALTIDNNQNVGLGVTPSANWSAVSALQLNSAGSLSSTNLYTSMQNGLVTTSGGYAWKYLTSTYGLAYLQSNTNGQHQWYTAVSGTAGNVAVPTQVMTLDASGNLGLATSSVTPRDTGATTLELYGPSSGRAAIKFTNSTSGTTGTDGMFLGYDSSLNFNILNNEAGAILFATNNTERARIDSSGNLLVGVTSVLSANIKFNAYQSSAGSFTAGFKSTKDGSNNSYFATFLNDAGTQVGYIYTPAQTGTSYVSASDRRLKSNITDITTSGEFIDALKPRNFTWTDANVVDQGFIADEFQTVVPLAVNGQANAVDSDGNPVYQAIEASSAQVIANLVAEVKSLRERLKAANIA
jgi:hypothetical protein